ncbi:autophagy-related protein 22-like protein [Polychytrium aggregatum]|uniref:autophagy-related protein 22-like protein n=1 Tax=Polychytrium aggregatum TaxID=110093 RepID=UPI0022FEE906|nr:autophagy-related protein 22-like protein [Polychytrium aggregatum]KAI9192931.1 autophagy-related protein 22-like protein [Polychytrium aggregatum]
MSLSSAAFTPDNQPVSSRELWGYYAFSFASQGFSGVSVLLLMPVIVRGLAAEAGWDRLDLSKPCDYTAANFSCCVQFGSSCVDTGSFLLYLSSFATVCQLLVLLAFGSLSDYGAHKKRFMILFSFLAIACGLGFLLVLSSSGFFIAGILYILSSVIFTGTFLFFNSFLPILARNHPEFTARASKESTDTVFDLVANRISANTMAIGFAADVILFVLGVLCVYLLGRIPQLPTSTYPSQVAVALTSVWWLVFIFFTIAWLKPRPGPPLPAGINPWTHCVKKIGRTLKTVVFESKSVARFLISWIIYSDCFNTCGSLSILIAQEEFGASQIELVLIGIVVNFSAIVGLKLFPVIQNLTGASSKTIIVAQAIAFCLFAIYCIVLLKNKWELWLCAVWYGILSGTAQSFCRVFYSRMIPPGQEAEYFSLMSVTATGSSALGPLIVGAIIDSSGSRRLPLWFILASFAVSAVLFATIQPPHVKLGKAEEADVN